MRGNSKPNAKYRHCRKAASVPAVNSRVQLMQLMTFTSRYIGTVSLCVLATGLQ